MITKEKLIKHINEFPSELSIDELIDKFIFAEKPEERIEQSEKNETVSEQVLKNEMKEWFRYDG